MDPLKEWARKEIGKSIGVDDASIVEMCIGEARDASSEHQLRARLQHLGLDAPQLARQLYSRLHKNEAEKLKRPPESMDDSWEAKQLAKTNNRLGDLRRPTVAADEESDDYEDEEDKSNDEDEINTPEFASDSSEAEDEAQDEKSTNLHSNVATALPVVAHRAEIVQLIRDNQVVIIAGETGSGKTTQIPQFLISEGYANERQIAITQPRRLAAMAVAARVADELGSKVGQRAGYTIRFDDKTSAATQARFLTEGMLVRQFMLDPKLMKFSVVMIDEAHERTVHTDIILALLKNLCVQRPELKVIISSATLNSQKFSAYFGIKTPVYAVPGRKFPVDIYYTKQPESSYLTAALMTIIQIHTSQPMPGDILVFMPGQDEIEQLEQLLVDTAIRLGTSVAEMIVCPVYGALPAEQQVRIFQPTPPNCRKVVLATNIAETSLTIDGIVFVVDPGLVKERLFNSKTNMDTFTVCECSQASANQRAGRAGRTGPGKCFRLYTKHSFIQDLPVETIPEVLRSNLASITLLLLSVGVQDVLGFDFIDKPPIESLVKALEQLYSLQAINKKCQLTTVGRCMAEIPTDPMTSRSLLKAVELDCIDDVATIMALVGEAGSLFYRPKAKRADANKVHAAFNDERGDHYSYLKVWTQWKRSGCSERWCREHFVQQRALRRARDVRDQLVSLACRLEAKLQPVTPISTHDGGRNVERALLAGYFSHVARLSRTKQNYMTMLLNQAVYIHPSSSLAHIETKPQLILYNELVLTSKEYMRGCLVVDAELIRETVPSFYHARFGNQQSDKQKNK